jgi:hypothetical protein
MIFIVQKHPFSSIHLFLEGASRALTEKGYSIKTIKPFLMGSFMDTFLPVPLKPLNSNDIDSTVLPYFFPNVLTAKQVNAVKNISRKAYAAVTFFEYSGECSLPSCTDLKSDLETIQISQTVITLCSFFIRRH